MKLFMTVIFFILLITSAYSLSGDSVSGGDFVLQKTWLVTVEHPENVDSVTLKVPVLYTSNVQRSNVTFDHEYTIKNGYYVIIIDHPNTTENITMTAHIKTDYDKWDITQPTLKEDYKTGEPNMTYGDLTSPSHGIIETAKSLESGDVYMTTVAITNWVYNHITYNLSYTDKRLPASEVYKIRQGTCDEYSHLTISMLKTLGIPARFVKGYSFSNKTWEPHAWVEYYNPKYGWLPIDPTFDEYVYLSGEKIAIVSADEQNDEMADSVSAIGHGKFNVMLSSEINIKTIKTKNRKIKFSILHNIENNDDRIDMKIILENLGDRYYFVPTTLVLPFDVGGYNKNIIVLAPYEKKVIIKRVNVSALENGNYKIPYHLNMFGYEYSGSFDLINHKSGSQNGNEKESGIKGDQLVNDMTKYWWLLLAPVVYFILTVIFRRLNRKQKI